MALTKVFSGNSKVLLAWQILATEASIVKRPNKLSYTKTMEWTQGSGSGQMQEWIAGEVDVTFASAVTVSLANADPFGAAGDTLPTGTIAELDLKLLYIYNPNTTYNLTVTPGTNGVVGLFSDASDKIIIPAISDFLWRCPAGIGPLTDATDDELDLQMATEDQDNVVFIAGFG